jgi:hypothetical protein
VILMMGSEVSGVGKMTPIEFEELDLALKAS